jgi:hypothetical protein
VVFRSRDRVVFVVVMVVFLVVAAVAAGPGPILVCALLVLLAIADLRSRVEIAPSTVRVVNIAWSRTVNRSDVVGILRGPWWIGRSALLMTSGRDVPLYPLNRYRLRPSQRTIRELAEQLGVPVLD